jgi:hypothetical protein
MIERHFANFCYLNQLAMDLARAESPDNGLRDYGGYCDSAQSRGAWVAMGWRSENRRDRDAHGSLHLAVVLAILVLIAMLAVAVGLLPR